MRNKREVVAVEKGPRKEGVSQTATINVKPTIDRTERPLTTQKKVELYLNTFGPIAQREMKKYKIPASITLAQGLLESGFGEGRLAVEGNNHFGIKCHSTWQGEKIYHDDDEKGECFRVYKDAAESYRDHSLFLSERDRYAFLFRLGKRDYKAWAKGLKKAGYATDPKYPDKLIRLIERFDLAQYDKKDAQEIMVQNIKTPQSNESIYVVQKGDTLYSIARKLKVDMNVLKRKNDLKDNTIYLGQELILPKK
ncbi:MAG: glucosaminidase domain-containing protein [Flavobacteriaceae bacterium]